jgi:hypothetical protein
MYYRCRGAFEGSGTGAGYAKVLRPLDVTIAAKLAKHHTGESTRIGKKNDPHRNQAILTGQRSKWIRSYYTMEKVRLTQ